MKYSLLLALALLSSISVFSQFRNTEWGMSKREVKTIEKEKLISDYENLKYEFHVDDMKCELTYNFANNDQLINITYEFSAAPPAFVTNNKYPVWDKTITNIKAKYGQPSNILSARAITWDLEKFSIKAYRGNFLGTEQIQVIYTPPAPSQKDIL